MNNMSVCIYEYMNVCVHTSIKGQDPARSLRSAHRPPPRAADPPIPTPVGARDVASRAMVLSQGLLDRALAGVPLDAFGPAIHFAVLDPALATPQGYEGAWSVFRSATDFEQNPWSDKAQGRHLSCSPLSRHTAPHARLAPRLASRAFRLAHLRPASRTASRAPRLTSPCLVWSLASPHHAPRLALRLAPRLAPHTPAPPRPALRIAPRAPVLNSGEFRCAKAALAATAAIVVITGLPDASQQDILSAFDRHLQDHPFEAPPVLLVPLAAQPAEAPALRAWVDEHVRAAAIDGIVWGMPTGYALALAVRAAMQDGMAGLDSLQDEAASASAGLCQPGL